MNEEKVVRENLVKCMRVQSNGIWGASGYTVTNKTQAMMMTKLMVKRLVLVLNRLDFEVTSYGIAANQVKGH